MVPSSPDRDSAHRKPRRSRSLAAADARCYSSSSYNVHASFLAALLACLARPTDIDWDAKRVLYILHSQRFTHYTGVEPSVCGWHGVYSHQYTCFARNWSSKEHERNTEVEVYYGNLTPQIRSVKIFSLVTSATGLAAQPLLLQKAAELNSLGLGIAIGSFVGFFTFITPFLLHWMTKKYVTHLRYNPETEKYTATTITFLLGNKKTTFTASDVTVPEVPGMFTTFLVQNKTALFVDPRLFNHPEHYARLMGYDKPLDFKLESVTQDENPSSKN
ncbi:hypothetical protein B566_EDAN006941 [Ephemera danica]|nr:hypothetical protein B566_EDAN006941 [Ephemera danica]